MHDITEDRLAAVDADGAIQEAMAETAEDERARPLRTATLAGGGLVAGAAGLALMGGVAEGATRRDVAILNYALTLEYLEAAFYTEAVRSGELSGPTLRFARIVGGHERAHVRALQKVLGRQAVKRPWFNFRGTTEDPELFRQTAQALEDTGVGAYAGQAPRIKADAVLRAALAIHTVEARHAAWIRHINGEPPAPRAFDKPLTMKQVLGIVEETRFIRAARPSMDADGDRPAFLG